jgi:cbb3-type cytochrome oxidase maturation protein
MSVHFIAIPIALLIALLAVVNFVIQVRNGQYDDLETPARRMLFDDVEQKGSDHDSEDHNINPR